MKTLRWHHATAVVIGLFCLSVLVSAGPAQAKQMVQIKLKGCKYDAVSNPDNSNCKMVVRERGVALCKQKKNDPDGGAQFCDQTIEWKIQNNKLADNQWIVVEWNEDASTEGSFWCLGSWRLTLTDDQPEAASSITETAVCETPQAWMYKVYLFTDEDGDPTTPPVQWAVDDPGVIFDG